MSRPTTLVLELSQAQLGTNVTCSWKIPATDTKSSCVFDFHRTYSPSQCSAPVHYPSDMVQVFIDGANSIFGPLPLADSCSVKPGWKVTGFKDATTLIKFTSTNLTETTITVGRYSSFAWTGCTNGSKDIMVTGSSWQSVEFPGHGLLLPPLIECTWSFMSPNKDGELGLTISPSFNGSGSGRCGSQDMLQVVDDGLYTSNSVTLSPCHIPKDFRYTSFGRSVSVTVMTFAGAMPGFSISYHEEPLENVCPTSLFQLSAVANQNLYFKGVNFFSGEETQRDCYWAISAPSPDMVVKLVAMYSNDYHLKLACKSNDTLTLEYDQTLSMCDNDRFPYWSQKQTTTFRFTATRGSEGSRFVFQYTAVPKAVCQGHPAVLTATTHAQSVSGEGLPGGDTSGNYDCRWLLRSNSSNLVVQATVKTSTRMYDRCYFDMIQAYDGPFVRETYLVPTCPNDDHRTEVFTSHGDTMLLRFDRRYHENVDITYAAVEKPPPSPTGRGKGLNSTALLVMAGLLAWVTVFSTR